jgi:hypothetical protein
LLQAAGDPVDAREILGYAAALLREHLGPDHLPVWEAQEKVKAVDRQVAGGNRVEQA